MQITRVTPWTQEDVARVHWLLERQPDFCGNPDVLFDINSYPPDLAKARQVFIRRLLLFEITKGYGLIQGDIDAGKTTFATAFVWMLKHHYSRPVTANVHFTEKFGEFTFRDSEELVEEIVKSNQAAEEGLTAEEAASRNISAIIGHTIFDDEHYLKIERVRPNTNVATFIKDIVRQMRHYDCLLLGAAPDISDLNSKIINYATFQANVERDMDNPYISRVYIYNYKIRQWVSYSRQKEPWLIDRRDWYPLFKTHNVVVTRRNVRTRDIEKKFKTQEIINAAA